MKYDIREIETFNYWGEIIVKFIEKDIKKACKNKSSFFMSEKSLSKIKSLTIWVSGDSISLKDLEMLPNLEDLYIDKHEGTYELKDLDVIYKCGKLKSLMLSKCKSFYMPVNYLQNLEELDFYDTEIDDFYFLKGMPELTDLILTGTSVRDIGFLRNLPSLKYLSLEGTSVRDISPMEYLDKLEEADFEDNELIEDYSVMKNLPSLLSYYVDGEYYDKDDEYMDEEEEEGNEKSNGYEINGRYEKNKSDDNQKIGFKERILLILAPILYLMVFFIVMLGIMKLPNIVPGFFKSSKVGYVEAVLYPTIICNGALAGGLILGSIGVIAGNIKWFRKLIRIANNDDQSEKLGFTGQSIFTLAILGIISIVFSVGFSVALLGTEDIFDIISRNREDLKIYKSGNGVKYYGTLQLANSYRRMEGIYYTGKYSQFRKSLIAVEYPHQGWRAGKNFSLVCPVTLSRNLKLEKNTDYLVQNLPNTKVVYSIEKLDRWNFINEVLEDDLFNGKMDISSDEMLSLIYSRGQYLEKSYPVLKEIMSVKEKYKGEYSKVDLDGNGEKDYLVILESNSGRKAVMGIIMINGKYQEVFLPEAAGDKNIIISKLNTKTYYLHDLKMVSKTTGEESILQYDGRKDYIRTSREK